jgi:hypothetical protein
MKQVGLCLYECETCQSLYAQTWQPLKCRVCPEYEIDIDLPWAQDPECQRFVCEHPDGASYIEISLATGLTDEMVKSISDEAMPKLRRRMRKLGISAADIFSGTNGSTWEAL